MSIRAVWRGTVLAESEETVVVEGKHYFPVEQVRTEHLEPSSKHTVRPWKGRASYYTVVVDDERNKDAAWYYQEPSAAASQIAGRIAFWRGVKVTSDAGSGAAGWWPSLIRRTGV